MLQLVFIALHLWLSVRVGTRSAMVSLGDNAAARVTLRPVLGFHSDWTRRFVIHEGQAVCFGFTLQPLTFCVPAPLLCRKTIFEEHFLTAPM